MLLEQSLLSDKGDFEILLGVLVVLGWDTHGLILELFQSALVAGLDSLMTADVTLNLGVGFNFQHHFLILLVSSLLL